jgi:hypothetical protein
MKTFKDFLEEMYMSEDMPVNNIAGSGATRIAKYDPIMNFKIFKRKPTTKGAKK